MRKLSVADYFVELLIENGIKDVFGYQGGMIAYIFDSLGKYRDKINYYSFGNEQGAAFAACSYAEATKNFAVAISTSGPGFTNMTTGIANAWFDSIPVIYLSGNVNTKDKKRNSGFRQNGFQEIQAIKMAKSITKKTYEIELGDNFISEFDDAIKEVMSDRRGPVYIDLPINICREYVEFDDIKKYEKDKYDYIDVNSIIDDLYKSERPVIIAGAGIKQAELKNDFVKLVDNLKVPVVSTLPAVGLLSSDNECRMGYIGGSGRREPGIVLQNADFVLSIGTRLCSKQIGHNMSLFIPKAKKFYRVDIDNTEFERQLRDVECDVNVNLKSFIKSVNKYLEEKPFNSKHKKWLDACIEIKNILKNADITYGNEIVRVVTELLPNNSNILFDVGKNLNYCGQSSIIKDDTDVYMSAGLGSMGYAIPASIGAYIGNKKLTCAFTGDGGAQMNIQELNTIAKNKLPIKIVVFNNKALGNIMMFQEVTFESRYVATSEKENDYFSCDFAKIAEAYGVKGIKLNDINDIIKFKDDLYSDLPVLFEIIYDDCPLLPSIVAGGDYITGGQVKLSVETQSAITNVLKRFE